MRVFFSPICVASQQGIGPIAQFGTLTIILVGFLCRSCCMYIGLAASSTFPITSKTSTPKVTSIYRIPITISTTITATTTTTTIKTHRSITPKPSWTTPSKDATCRDVITYHSTSRQVHTECHTKEMSGSDKTGRTATVWPSVLTVSMAVDTHRTSKDDWSTRSVQDRPRGSVHPTTSVPQRVWDPDTVDNRASPERTASVVEMYS